MVIISQSLVKLPPYSITVHSDTGFYTFITDQGVQYTCRFGDVMAMIPPLLGIYDIEVKDFMFYPYDPEPEKRKKLDLRISETIKDLLRSHYFIKPERVIVYTCDDSDRAIRGFCRQKLFNNWHAEMSDIITRYELEVNVETDSGTETIHGGIIVRKDFPFPDILQRELIDQAPGIILEKFG